MKTICYIFSDFLGMQIKAQNATRTQFCLKLNVGFEIYLLIDFSFKLTTVLIQNTAMLVDVSAT